MINDQLSTCPKCKSEEACYIVEIENKNNSYSIYTLNEDLKDWKNVYPGLNCTISYLLENLNLNIKKIDHNDIYNIAKIFNCIVDSVDVSEKKNKIEVDTDKVLKRLKNVRSFTTCLAELETPKIKQYNLLL
jgi:hypothetical protein